MAYMTTALIDGPKMDMSLEAAACKIYGSEAMFRAINDCIQVLGGMGFSAGGVYPFERLLRDSRILLIFEGTNEILRLFIALTAIQAPGEELKELSRNLKNPAYLVANAPKLISQFLHSHGIGVKPLPGIDAQLAPEAAFVGQTVAFFYNAVQRALIRHGKNIIEQQLVVQRLANAAIDIYACMAVLSRATAAIKAKNEHVDHEVLLARTFVKQAKARIGAELSGLIAGTKASGDEAVLKVATDVLGAGKYLATHPLRV